ncbi:MAG TPA: transposase [Hanamia sp.]|nr:transposase [Hanamia sp.]
MYPGNYYHVYNHANGNESLFREQKNYLFFLEKVSLHILPFVKLHAYCLLPNHFHLLIYVREFEELKLLKQFKTLQNKPDEELQLLMEKNISKSFSNLFSSYAQSYNKIYERKGSLFMPNMKANIIVDNSGICKVTYYVHINPVHHGFVKNLEDWKFSSYNSYLSDLTTKLSKKEIIEIFGSKNYFIEYHKQPVELKLNWDK